MLLDYGGIRFYNDYGFRVFFGVYACSTNGIYPIIEHSPKTPSIQIVPTSGSKVYKWYLLWAIWTSRALLRLILGILISVDTLFRELVT